MFDSLTLTAIETLTQKSNDLVAQINSVSFPSHVAEYEPGFCAYVNACDLAEHKIRMMRARYDLCLDAIGYLKAGNFQHAAIVMSKLLND